MYQRNTKGNRDAINVSCCMYDRENRYFASCDMSVREGDICIRLQVRESNAIYASYYMFVREWGNMYHVTCMTEKAIMCIILHVRERKAMNTSCYIYVRDSRYM